MSTRTPLSIDGVVPWPDDVADRYRKAGYWQGTSITSHVAEQVTRRPDDEALIDGSTRLTYRQLWDKSSSCAQSLLDLSLAPGDRIVLQLPNCWEFVALTLACFRIGVIPVMALPAHRRHELTHLASLAEAVAIVVADADRDTAEAGEDVTVTSCPPSAPSSTGCAPARTPAPAAMSARPCTRCLRARAGSTSTTRPAR